ncbi:MAG: dienelactone hydrolase family protein, partial [Pirellulaceae bacterium]|nr:dienelactone hydrolase family protein [Pirellulaceae bacterium]
QGGGGAPVAVNDQQWRNQQRLYSPKEGVYLAPRAATNTWNLWHQGHIDGMFGRLIENLVAFEDVNPNRVYVMGYSAGGDGVYQLAPRMADQWAAAAMMAGHPNDSSPQSLRNIGFTLHVGGRDAAYNRNKVAAEWEKRLAALQKDDPGGYRHLVKIHSDKGHWMDREDRVAVPWMSKFARDPYPDRIVWRQDDVTHSRFYWLAVDDKNRQGRSLIIADRKAQTISLESEQIKQVKVRLHDDLIDLDKPIVIKTRDQVVFEGKPQRTIAVIATSLSERIDPGSVFTAEVTVSLAEK